MSAACWRLWAEVMWGLLGGGLAVVLDHQHRPMPGGDGVVAGGWHGHAKEYMNERSRCT